MRHVSGPQGPRVVLDGRPVLLLCSNNYLGLADHPRVREAAADAAMRWGAGAGASRLVSGTMTVHRRLEEALAAFKGTESARAVRLGLPGQPGRDRHVGAPGRRRRRIGAPPPSSSPTSSTTRRSSTAAAWRAPRPSSTTTATSSTSRGDCAAPRTVRGADRHRLGLLDGRRHRAAGRDRRAGAPPRRADRRRRGPRHRLPRSRRTRRGRRGGAGRRDRRRRRHARQGAGRLRRVRRLQRRDARPT